MAVRAQVTRSVKLPDPHTVARFERAPELGPRLLFFSGGSALRPLSRVLKRYTHNSVHLITPFDSGGSSAELRNAFQMLSIGDLRNRLVALADESVRGNPEIYRLFCHRLPTGASANDLLVELGQMVAGDHLLVEQVPQPMGHIIRTHLRFFMERAPGEFDLRGANIGNLLLTGGYLAHERDIESTLFLFSKLLEVRGVVRPIADNEFHLAGVLADGSELVGQHRLTGKRAGPVASPITDIYLVKSLEEPAPVSSAADEKVLRLIRRADLIVYPIGSFYTSVLANLLPKGVGRGIVEVDVPKVYVPNAGDDPEQLGMTISDALDELVRVVQRDAGNDAALADIVQMVIVDARGAYVQDGEIARLRARGLQVLDLPIMDADSGFTRVVPEALTETLLSMC